MPNDQLFSIKSSLAADIWRLAVPSPLKLILQDHPMVHSSDGIMTTGPLSPLSVTGSLSPILINTVKSVATAPIKPAIAVIKPGSVCQNQEAADQALEDANMACCESFHPSVHINYLLWLLILSMLFQ